MANYQALSSIEHRTVRVAPQPAMHFAAHNALVAIYVAELARASKTLPLAFAQLNGQLTLMAVMGLAPEENRFVLPDGRWNGDYIPATFRCNPFGLVHDAQGNAAIALDMESSLVGSSGEVLFDLMGEPTSYLKSVITYLQELDTNRNLTLSILSVLTTVDVLVPLEIEPSAAVQQKITLNGIFKVDETKLNALSDEDFLTLRNGGCLPVIYAHLLSLGNLQRLQNMAKPMGTPTAASPFAGLERDGQLHFGGL